MPQVWGCWAWSFISLLGGFNDEKLEVVDLPTLYVYGEVYKGEYGDKEIGDLFAKSKELVEGDSEAEAVVIINYKSAEKEEGEVKYLIGVLANDSFKNAPSNWTKKELGASKAIKVSFDKSLLVMPSPETVFKAVNEFAKTMDKQMLEYSIEEYYPDNKMEVFYPLKSE